MFNENGLIKQTENAKFNMNMAKAREKLELVLLDAAVEKKMNLEYNQEGFLNKMILEKVQGSKIIGDVAIVDGFAFELDRSVPKIGKNLGLEKDMIFPKVNAIAQLAEDKKSATINITALEEKKGINKIEIWVLGEKLEEYTYDNIKTEIKVEPPYVVTQNGEYTIKVYGELWSSITVNVIGIMPGIEFEPNGNATWKKEHSTKIKLQETDEKIKSLKYQWTNSVEEPANNTFELSCKDGDIIKEDRITGTYYLWILLETENGVIVKRRSEGFNYDNESPQIISYETEKYSADVITFNISVKDNESGISKIEFYVDDILKDTKSFEDGQNVITKSFNITGISMGKHLCKIVVYDAIENNSSQSKDGSTMMYTWEKWDTVVSREEWKVDKSWIEVNIGEIREKTDCRSMNTVDTGWRLYVKQINKYQPTWTTDNRRVLAYVGKS